MKNRCFHYPTGIILSIWLMALSMTLFAKAPSSLPSYKALSFTKIDVDGIDSLSAIVAIEQDSHGFLWFGGKNGVVRFDGYQAQSFRYQPDNPNGLGSNDISDLHVDRRGHLWVAQLSGGGLSRYDAARRRFVHYTFSANDERSLGANAVYAIAEDKEGNLWLGTHGGGLNKYDQESGLFTRYQFDPENLDSISDNVIRDLDIDDQGYIWLATATGGLNRFDPKTEKSKLFVHREGDPLTLSENELSKVFVDSEQNIWVGTFSQGVNYLARNANQFVRYENQLDDKTSIGGGQIWDIIQDAYGSIWVASGNGDLNRYNENANNFQRITHKPHNEQSISGSPTSLFVDNAGTIWIGSYFSSVDNLNLNATKFTSLDLSSIDDARQWPRNITAMAIDLDNTLWMSTDEGLAYYELDNARLHYLADDKNVEGTLPNFPIRAIMVDTLNNIWVGTAGGGLSVYRRATKKIEQFGPDLLSANKIWAIHQDRYGDIWVGTQTRGLAKYDRELNEFKYFQVDESDPSKIANPFIWDIYSDSYNNLWVGTQKGLIKIDADTRTISRFMNVKQNPHSISSNSVRAITEDSKGYLWIATDSGLNRYDKKSKTFQVFRLNDGLVDDNISAVSHDKYGHIWFSTQKGLSQYYPRQRIFDHFDYRNGIVGRSFPRKAIAKDRKGNIFVGNSKGVTILDPNVDEKNTFIPPVLITGVSLMNQPLVVGGDSPLEKETFYTRSIRLEDKHSLITFEFAALSYYISSQNKYAYKLEGFDKNWHYVDSSERKAVYTNLDPGKYTFYVKGSNNDGVWNDIPAQLTIIIPPPWYITWWARSAAIFLCVAILYFIVSYRLRQNRFRRILLQKKVHEKTKELATANDAIKELNHALEERVALRTNELSIEIEERRQVEEKLFHMAFHDALTGLPNRYWLVQELKARIGKLKTDKNFKFALLFLDGDRFKQINDTHGHLLGDKLLVSVAIRLKTMMDRTHHVVRLGGDEFTILIDDVETIDEVKETAQSIINSFEKPFYPEQNKIYFKVSIGMVLCEELYSKPEQILRDADIALYRAKDKGKGVFQIFDSKMREETLESSVLENDLHAAINSNELYLQYQPIVNLEDGQLTGFEALLRWQHPEKGLINPDKFIPIAEEAGLITIVGLIALEKACAQLKKWIEQCHLDDPLIMSVNLSSVQLNQPDLLERIDEIFAKHDIDGRWIKLEITESALMERSQAVTTLLNGLRERGMVLAIDDFGTGYSSLSYLDQLPVQVLKIDRSFVSGINSNSVEGGGAMEIVRATISLAHNLRMFVVAEGIESETQLKILRDAGCDYGQGYWISKPLLEDKATEMIRSNRGLSSFRRVISEMSVLERGPAYKGVDQRSRRR